MKVQLSSVQLLSWVSLKFSVFMTECCNLCQYSCWQLHIVKIHNVWPHASAFKFNFRDSCWSWDSTPSPRVPACDNRLSYIGRTLAVVDGMKKTYTGTRTCRRTETNTVCPVGQYLDISSFRREKLLANRKEAVSWEWFLWESRGTWTSEKLLIDRWFWLVFDVKAMIIFHPILRNY